MPIIDCHVHLNYYPDTDTNKTKHFVCLEDRLKVLLESMDYNDVDYSLILSSYRVDEYRPSTAQIIEMTKKYENRFGVIAGFTIDNHSEEDLNSYRKWLKDGLIKGIKLYCGYEHHYPYDEGYQRVYDICTEYGAPVMIHTGDTFSNTGKIRFSHPLNIDDIAVDNPELRIIMCHLGNPWIVDCQEILYKNKNIYADISGLFIGNFTLSVETSHYISKIRELLRYVGVPHRLLYGTDWPICDMESYIKFVRKLNLDRQSFDLLMFGNSEKIFALK
ncbi:MAG TPA: amidohydrolase family protein [Nitrososphaeraceae archaeon]|jgi:uncharacterized protein